MVWMHGYNPLVIEKLKKEKLKRRKMLITRKRIVMLSHSKSIVRHFKLFSGLFFHRAHPECNRVGSFCSPEPGSGFSYSLLVCRAS